MKKPPGVRRQRKLLGDCALDFNLGQYRIIYDADNEEYFKLRAIELIRTNNLDVAIGLLGLVLSNRAQDT